MMKKTFSTLIILLISITTYSQSVKEYYIPDSVFNKASFFMMSPKGERIDMERIHWYVKRGANYDVLDGTWMKGRQTTATTMTIQFTKTEVKWLHSTITNTQVTGYERSNNPPVIVFKIPLYGQSVSWEYIDIMDDKVKCTASWTVVTINGMERKAIKCVKHYQSIKKTWMVEYYVKGIGFWKSEMQNEDVVFTYEKFDGLTFDPTVK